MEGSVLLSNALGRAEELAVSVEAGASKANNSFTLSATQPRPAGRHVILDARLHQQARSCEKWSSYAERLRGGEVTLTRSGSWPGCARGRCSLGSSTEAPPTHFVAQHAAAEDPAAAPRCGGAA